LEKSMFNIIGSPPSRGLGRRSARQLLATALGLALVAGAPATARAETVSDPDAVGDMVTFDDQDAAVQVPERTLNDVSSTKLRHGARRIAVRVDYVDLKRKAGGDYQRLGILMVTDEGLRRYVSLEARRGQWSGESQMHDRKFDPIRCPVRHSIDYEDNTMKVSFPRRCAGNPSWVEFRVWAESMGDDGYYGDDALRDRPISSQAGHMKRSNRVHRQSTG
jgi:hypothetical protein